MAAALWRGIRRDVSGGWRYACCEDGPSTAAMDDQMTEVNAESEKKAIEAVVVEYLEGMIYGQRDRLERALHPKCMQAGHYNGIYEFFDRETFIGSVEGETALPPGTPYRSEIVSMEMTGDVAVVKVEDDCLGTSFTDYLTLIKHENQWQIVMKAFFDHANA
jgi:hypothetical protein